MSREPARSDMLNGEDDASLPYDLRRRRAGARGGLRGRGRAAARPARGARATSTRWSSRTRSRSRASSPRSACPARRNAGSSHRRGVELELGYAPSERLRLAANAACSRNRIDAWTQFYDVYDAEGAWLDSASVVHHDVAPLLTPEAILNGSLEWKPTPEISLLAAGRYVSAAQLDNTGNPDFRTPAFFTLDAQASLSLRRLVAKGEPRIRVQATNLLDERRSWPSGYSYLYFVRDGSPATRSRAPRTTIRSPPAACTSTLDVRF